MYTLCLSLITYNNSACSSNASSTKSYNIDLYPYQSRYPESDWIRHHPGKINNSNTVTHASVPLS